MRIPLSSPLLIATLLACAAAGGPASAVSADTRPNLLFIMSDDHAEQAISAYGSSLMSTPNIDRIAAEGMLFRNALVTNSICAPSRATLLTGQYSHRNGLRDNRDEFDGSQMTFPKLLRSAGYQTAIVGKWHLKTEPTGFDHWKILQGQGFYYRPVFLDNGERVEIEGYATDLITEHALEFLEGRDRDRPFLLMLHHKAPHRNWMPAIRHLGRFADRPIPTPATFDDDYAGRSAAALADMRIEDMYLSLDMKLQPDAYGEETGTGGHPTWDATDTWRQAYERMTDEERQAWDDHYGPINRAFAEHRPEGAELLEWLYRRYMEDYLASIAAVDEGVGRVLDYLEEEGLADDTVVVYTSDQGFYLGEHGWYDKRFMYEESLGTPLLVRYPKTISPGHSSEELVANLDLAPTLLDYAGVEIPEAMQGSSLRPLLEGEPVDEVSWRDAFYYRYYEYPHGWHSVLPHYGIRTKTHKLIHFEGDPAKNIQPYRELFDLEADPHELANRYGDPELAELQARLERRLAELQAELGDTPEGLIERATTTEP